MAVSHENGVYGDHFHLLGMSTVLSHERFIAWQN